MLFDLKSQEKHKKCHSAVLLSQLFFAVQIETTFGFVTVETFLANHSVIGLPETKVNYSSFHFYLKKVNYSNKRKKLTIFIL